MAEYLNEYEPNDTAFEGCPDPTAGSAIINLRDSERSECEDMLSTQGPGWKRYGRILTRSGQSANNFNQLPDNALRSMVLFQNALCPCQPVKGELIFADPANGNVCAVVPPRIANSPGIYQVEAILASNKGNPVIKESMLLSVERSLLGRFTGSGSAGQGAGPLTLGEIRTQLRDFPALNTAWDTAEFSDKEIVHALLQPVMAFNEMPPRGAAFTANNSHGDRCGSKRPPLYYSSLPRTGTCETRSESSTPTGRPPTTKRRPGNTSSWQRRSGISTYSSASCRKSRPTGLAGIAVWAVRHLAITAGCGTATPAKLLSYHCYV